MGRFERHPAPAADVGPAERLQLAGEEITRLRARVSALEQALETENRIRLEAGALLVSEQMRVRQLEEQLAAREEAAPSGTSEAAPEQARSERAPEQARSGPEQAQSPQVPRPSRPRRFWESPDPS